MFIALKEFEKYSITTIKIGTFKNSLQLKFDERC
jgi:hypothetical protein